MFQHVKQSIAYTPAPDAPPVYYVVRERGMLVARQSRYRQLYFAGQYLAEDPIASARNRNDLASQLALLQGSVDWSLVE